VRFGEPIPTDAEYLVLLGPTDVLAPDALDVLSRAIIERGEPDLVCGDGDGGRLLPGWSPELLLATMEPEWTIAVRRERFEAVGGFREGFDGRAALYDLALRLTDDAYARVLHVPHVFAKTNKTTTAATRAIEADQGARAVAQTLQRRGINARVRRPAWSVREARPVFELEFPDKGPTVAIVIPTRNRVDLLRRCVGSVLSRTSYRSFRVVVVDDRSDDPTTIAYLNMLGDSDERCRVARRADDGQPFSYAKVNNDAVRGLRENVEFVVFLNNDTEVRRPDWLSTMVGYGQMAGVGAVGARLLYPDGRVQHAGMITNLHDGMPGHAFKLAPWWDRGPLALASVARACSAVTAACLLTRRSVFLESGGFDEERFAVAYNDIDYCLRLGELGLRTVYAPGAELLHFEGATRGYSDNPAETALYLSTWGDRPDLYWNPNWAPGDERLRAK
jgi:GT2 family glycosyltransferase